MNIQISHDDAPEWVIEKFVDGIRRFGLTVTDLSNDEKPICEFQISGPLSMWIVYDVYSAHHAYFTSEDAAQSFVNERIIEERENDLKRFQIRKVELNAKHWQ